jgi:hypothetical protein
MLGLFVDSQNQLFRSFLKQLAEGRRVRNPQIIKCLNDLGMAITMDEVEAEAGVPNGGIASHPTGKSVGRPHIAAVLIKKGYVKTKQEAFDRFLAKGQPAYVSRFVASSEESINQIHSARGLAILAHPPYLLPKDEAELESTVRDLKAKGLDGLEVYFSTHTADQTAMCLRVAKKLDLVISGGSDFHGELGRGGAVVELGAGVNNNLSIPYDVLATLKKRHASRM